LGLVADSANFIFLFGLLVFFCLPFGLGWIFFAPHFERTRGQSKHASKAKKTAEQKKDLDLFPCFSMFLSIQIKHAMNWLLYFLSRATS